MQVTETKSEGLKRAYVAKALASDIDAKVDAKLEAVRPTAELKGFRKGKVPPALLKKMFGKSMFGEAMQEIVDEGLRAHLAEQNHKPTAQPQVRLVNEDFKEGDDLDVEFEYELMPEIPDVSFSAISLERLVAAPAEDAVQEALESLAKNARSFETKDGAAEDGDQVVISFVGRVDGEAFDGGSAEDFPLALGSNQFIPGFEEKLIGATAGETRAVDVTFPADYAAAELAGKDAVFDTEIKEVKAPKAAEIDDAMAQQYGAADLDALKTQVRERLAEEYGGASRALLKRALLDKLAETVVFELPPSMVENEAKQIAHQLWHEANPEVEGHDHGEIEVEPEHAALAERRVRLGLLLADIGQKNGVELTDAEIANGVMTEARRYPGQEKAFYEFASKNPGVRERIAAPLFEDKVVDYVFELSDVSEKTVTADELKAALEALSEADDKDAKQDAAE